MKKVLKYIVGVALLPLALAGCTSNFDEYNTNPYEPTTLDVRQFFAEMQDCFASPEENPYQRNATFWACFGGYITAPHSWSRSTLYSTWNIDDDWNKWTVDWYYTKFYPSYFQVENYTEKQGQYYALAVLHRVAVMQYVLNLQGPLPYSQVTNGKYAVPYDDEKTAWHKMFDDLDFAIAELSNAIDPNYRPMSGYDRVYNGDYEKWVKFANSLKLRLALRVVYADQPLAKEMAESAVKHEVGVMTSNDDNAMFASWGTDGNPIRVAVRYNMANSADHTCGTSGDSHVAADIICYMNGYNDPRREAYFTRSEWSGYDYVGLRRGITIPAASVSHMYCGPVIEVNDPVYWMNAAEVAFLKAEAVAVFGFDMGTDAKSAYEEGIRLSFDQYGVSGYASYIADASSRPALYTDPAGSNTYTGTISEITVAWDDNATAEQKQERILTQKWIANWLLGNEAWADFRRTGYPRLIPVANNKSTDPTLTKTGARRIEYPDDEATSNAENYQSAVSTLLGGADNMATRLWFDCKQNNPSYN